MQLALFDELPPPDAHDEIVPYGAHPDDVDRLTGHNAVILSMLQIVTDAKSEITNVALAAVSMNHTARISNIRAHLEKHVGMTVRCRRGKGGVNYYRLEPLPK